uniref:Beta-sarcoglycan n=1 Tax=Parascaris univalens TaxID=6257 RepID=A0A915C7T5_PARUN
MPAGGPTYLRSGQAELPEFKESPSVNEYNLHVTGLREKRLWILLGFMVVLTALTVAVLIMNIFMMRVLSMSTRGMKNLQFHSRYDTKSGEEESVLQFTAERVHLGKVVAKSGIVRGSPGKDLTIHGSRVIINGAKDRSHLLLQEGLCRFEDIDQFVVKGANRPFFSAQHPLFTVDSRVRKISTEQIITNKIRSPINENLHAVIENLSVRGNEGIKMEAKRFNMTAKTSIGLRTSKDGKLTFSAKKIFIGSNWLPLPISTSPALTASIDAMRVCICIAARPKLFVVAGNKPCIASPNFCV